MSEALRIEVPEAVADGDGWGEEFALPSGRKARVREGIGKDMRLAQMAAGEPFDQGRFDNALTARLSMVDGKGATFEQIEAMKLADFMVLKTKVAAAQIPPPPAGEDNASSGSETPSSPAS